MKQNTLPRVRDLREGELWPVERGTGGVPYGEMVLTNVPQ